MEHIVQLATWLKEAQTTVVLTGAGMSTESGVPDFRSAKGMWQQIDPQRVATIDVFEQDYTLFHQFYSMRLENLAQCLPHEGHHILAELQQQGDITLIATQNVDGFHTQAGAKNIAELHGNIHHIRCQRCHTPHTELQFMNKVRCSCGGRLRPGVVLFGEFLPEHAWQTTLSTIKRADLVIVIGTSLQVSPVNQLPAMTRGKKVYINAEVTDPSLFDLVIQRSAKETLIALKQTYK